MKIYYYKSSEQKAGTTMPGAQTTSALLNQKSKRNTATQQHKISLDMQGKATYKHRFNVQRYHFFNSCLYKLRMVQMQYFNILMKRINMSL